MGGYKTNLMNWKRQQPKVVKEPAQKIAGLTANALTKHTLKILDLKGFHVWRQNNGGVYDRKFGGYRANSATKGISDILGFNRKTGQIIAAEIKAGKDKLSIEQEVFLKAVERSGGIALVVRTLDDLDNFIKQESHDEKIKAN